MKRKLMVAAMAAAFFAAPAWAQRDAGMMGDGMMGSGTMGGAAMEQGMMGGHAAVNLSEEQRAKIADIRRELAGKHRDLALEARKRIDAVLTDEQRAQLRNSSPCHAEERRS